MWLFYRFIRSVLYILYRLFFWFKFSGSANVPPESDPRGVILAPNHASFLDPPVLGISLKRHVTYLAKDYLFKAFFVGTVLRNIGALPIKTEAQDFRSIRELVRILKDGRCIVVFPEGTRSPDGSLRPAEEGVGFLAMKSQATVVPVYIEGSYAAFPRHKKFFRCSHVSVKFGKASVPALDPAFQSAERPYTAVGEKIMQEIVKLKEQKV